ncbi:MAG: right-handed parallel beta-helix repeat-containing protein [Nitrospirales bacterium]|nr:right-handed parallel beta-helix repeat-containing protein [Nitrospirales bacterium]
MEHCNKNRGVQLFLSFVLISGVTFSFAGISEVIAKEYFVSASNGNDKNSGTQQEPYLSLTKGVSVLTPGDILFIRGGIYKGSSSLSNIPNGNSWSNPVTIKAFQNEKVVITAEPGETVLKFNATNQYIILDGLILDGTGGVFGVSGGNTGTASHHIRIQNSEIKNAEWSGLIIGGTTHHYEFLNLHVHHNGSNNLDHGFYITTANNLVSGCVIHDNSGRGISLHSSGKQEGVDDNLVIRNKVFDNGTSSGSPGILVGYGLRNALVNNLVWGNQIGILVFASASETKVYHNIVYGNSNQGIFLRRSNKASLVVNNIISMNGSVGLLIESGSGMSKITNNLIYSDSSGKLLANNEPSAILSNNKIGTNYNPQFFNPVDQDFHLKMGSPAINAGGVISEVEYDFDFLLRNQKKEYDMGAYLFLESSQRPPTNLRVVGTSP